MSGITNWSHLQIKLRSILNLISILLFVIPTIHTYTNNECDWTGSGLSTSRENRDIVSIYLRCTAGKITWKYPRGAIRVILRPPITNDQSFRVCLKIHPESQQQSNNPSMSNQATQLNQTNDQNDVINRLPKTINKNRIPRIYLESQKKLVLLFQKSDKQIVKCFMSAPHKQVGLYVEADQEMSFENNIQTEFEYNLQFLNNNKQYSIRSQSHQNEKQNHFNDKQRHLNETNKREKGNWREQQQHQQKQEQSQDEKEKQQQQQEYVQPQQVRDSKVQPTNHYFSDTNLENVHNRPHKYNFDKTIIGTWFSWFWPQWNTNENKMQMISTDSNYNDNRIDENGKRENKIVPKNYEILNSFGESWEICRPCTDVEMVEAFCSSEYVVRGRIFQIQDRPILDTIEISVLKVKTLRNNLLCMEGADDSYLQCQGQQGKSRKHHHRRKPTTDDTPNELETNTDADQNSNASFHRPSHCLTSYGEGEFIFMGRRRFNEMMLVCAPRLEEWATIVQTYTNTNDAPCILSS